MSTISFANTDAEGNFHPRVLDRLRQTIGGGAPGSDSVFAALDMREPVEVVIAHASDSTGDQPNEYFEASWQSALSQLWPERPARLKRWVIANHAYGPWIEWSSGDAGDPQRSYTTAFSDNFNRADSAEGDLGAAWGSSTAYKIASNRLTMNPSLSVTELLGTGSAPSPDHRVSAKITRGNGSTTGVMVRVVNSNNYYAARINATGNVLIYKVVNGTTTALGGLDNAWTADGATLTLEAESGALRAYVDGVQIVTATAGEAALNVATRYGVRAAAGTTPPTFDDFTVETFATATPPASVPEVTVYNGAAAGQTAEYQRVRLADVYPVRPDVLFINHGHNYTTIGDVDGFLASVQGLVEDLNALYPGDPIPVVVTSQNPQFGSGREADHLRRMKALRGYATRRGWGYIPTYEAFAALPDGGASQLSDSVHPSIEAGRVLMSGVAQSWISNQSERA